MVLLPGWALDKVLESLENAGKTRVLRLFYFCFGALMGQKFLQPLSLHFAFLVVFVLHENIFLALLCC